ncbi:cell division topological specificity factor MinE [Formicincola oecophyllae]|uniref:Cell division topological specificity factor n=1 Tax=Formicincola oecophyllae TaxID=2558361 RepID=A0A4Y6U9T8_9PROT|nr:cell division topological specificity factor MinE [Formicincola oecophyllae]QDH13216.1 cell division topological specificity factor MinE [Formicincola oecophyllae]
MNLFNRLLGKRPAAPSARVARDRLKILLVDERRGGHGGDNQLIEKLRTEIMAVLSRHVPVQQDMVHIKLDRKQDCSTLEIDVEMPEQLASSAKS